MEILEKESEEGLQTHDEEGRGERRMMLFEIVALVCLAFFCVGMITMIFCMVFQDTDTFMAIDEKIAEMIRGKDNEEEE